MGIPTANLQLDELKDVPRGVYAVRVHWADREPLLAVANIGKRPTFEEQEISVEVHILDFDGNLYGEMLHVVFVEFLRSERAFATADDLLKQIREDIDKTKQLKI